MENEKQKRTFILPFVVLSSLVLPSQLVVVYVKPTAGYDALVASGWFGAIWSALGVVLAVASVSAIVYLVRARGWAGRAAVLLSLVVLWGAFVYGM